MATLQDVADRAGVSVSTVSRALHETGQVKSETSQRIRSVADQLHFSLSRSASSLASGKTMRVVYLTYNNLNTWYTSQCMEGLYTGLYGTGYDLIPYVTTVKEDLDAFIEELPSNGNLDGLVLTSFPFTEDQLTLLRGLHIPTVAIDSNSPDVFDASVMLDNKSAMYSAVQLLQRLGHTSIAYVGDLLSDRFFISSRTRCEYFLDAAHQLGYGDDNIEVFTRDDAKPEVNGSQSIIAQYVSSILSSPKKPTALCASTDYLAMSLIHGFREVGVSVPDDFSIVGFDDMECADLMDLTTLHQDPLKTAKLAAEKLLKLMKGEEVEERYTEMKASLVVRHSTKRAS
ncbi:LacI family DNA-binding transcriptional regulator [Bifidobacterium sp. ESL0775]|uniref:LacI family DNA-binding transcriptional regulator n=1 Tax=Bifidobacterium sp. ESL0775 TaxID=2983230 RepID=UPI0023F62559|nr:LacI family DNA-binding transcriptional regulator [Bifidobacterium sp. ESL0775]WEV69506.1 LacI family DNA-binding transcriptional regulator [Bifidobacterium sp. ESL0775]